MQINGFREDSDGLYGICFVGRTFEFPFLSALVLELYVENAWASILLGYTVLGFYLTAKSWSTLSLRPEPITFGSF